MQQLRRLTALIAVAVVVGSCAVHESTRGGGLVPPTGPAVTAPAPTVVTVVAESAISQSGEIGAMSVAATGARLDTTSIPVPQSPEPDPAARARRVLAATDPPEGFGEGVLGVRGPAGTQLWPVIIADTSQARQRGLMGVTDFAALGGYAAMVFIFEGDTSGAFWMRDTPLPLRITFVTAGGSVVSATDMVPCLAPTPSGDCERYHPAGPYRIAIEHPVGPAFDLGLADAELVEVTIE